MATAERDDAALVKGCLAGEAAAWEQLLHRYRRLIYSVPVAFRFTNEDADDVFQRVAMKLIEGLPKLRDTAALPSWLATVARHECHALHRISSRNVDAPVEDHDPGVEPPDLVEALESVAQEHAMARALERLDSPCRGLLTMLYVDDPTPPYEEIAKRLGRPIGSLGPTRSRCLGKLRKLYESRRPEPG